MRRDKKASEPTAQLATNADLILLLMILISLLLGGLGP
jgi:hypothetical protein